MEEQEQTGIEGFDNGDTRVAPTGEFQAGEKVKLKKIRCSQCNSAQIYVLKDGTHCCRKCGFREQKDVKEIKEEDEIKNQASGNKQD